MTPKEQFLETPHAAEHRKTVQTEAFRQALNYAMLEMQRRQHIEDPAEPFAAAKQASRLAGAYQFRTVLESLATVLEEVPRGTQPPSIDYNAYDRPSRTR